MFSGELKLDAEGVDSVLLLNCRLAYYSVNYSAGQSWLQERGKEGCHLIGYWAKIPNNLSPESQTLPLTRKFCSVMWQQSQNRFQTVLMLHATRKHDSVLFDRTSFSHGQWSVGSAIVSELSAGWVCTVCTPWAEDRWGLVPPVSANPPAEDLWHDWPGQVSYCLQTWEVTRITHFHWGYMPQSWPLTLDLSPHWQSEVKSEPIIISSPHTHTHTQGYTQS